MPVKRGLRQQNLTALLKWFESYLSQRFQMVVIPGGTSEWVEIKAGNPQGSIIGLLLFI